MPDKQKVLFKKVGGSAIEHTKKSKLTPKDKAQLKKLGAGITVLREGLGLTKVDLAIKAEIDETCLRKMENGGINSSVINILKLAKAFGMKSGDFLNAIDK